MTYRVAFASIDGTHLDQHFGSARYWQIYDIGSDAQFVETRKTAAYCRGNCEGGFDHLLTALHDCAAVFALKIGEYAARTMIANGKRVFEASGELDEIIARIIDDNLLDANQ